MVANLKVIDDAPQPPQDCRRSCDVIHLSRGIEWLERR